MNELLRKLSGCDLRSEGRVNEVAEEVIRNPQLLSKFIEGLSESDNVIRARTAHALEILFPTQILRSLILFSICSNFSFVYI